MHDIATDTGLETLIISSQKLGFIYSHELLVNEKAFSYDDVSGILKEILSKAAIFKLTRNGLIENLDAEKNAFPLTQKGMRFKSFQICDEQYLAEQAKIKHDLQNAARLHTTYWWSFGLSVFAFLISLYLLILKLKGM